MDTRLFSCKSILTLVNNAVDGCRMISEHRQTCDLSSLFYFMQIEISASSRNPTCEISPVVQLLLAPSLNVWVSGFFLPVSSRRHS